MDEQAIRQIIRAELAKYDSGFEDRLAIAIQKAFDTVLTEVQFELRQLQEDVAALQKHHGLG